MSYGRRVAAGDKTAKAAGIFNLVEFIRYLKSNKKQRHGNGMKEHVYCNE